MARIRETSGATIRVRSQSTSTIRASGLPPPFPAAPASTSASTADLEVGAPSEPEGAPHPVRQQRDGPHHPGEQCHEPHIEVPHVCHLVSDHPLELVPAQRREQPPGHRDAGGVRVPPGGERVGVVIGDHPHPGLRQSGGDRHLLDHVDQLPLVGRRGLDDLPGPGRPEHPLGPAPPGVPTDPGGEDGGDETEEGNDMVVSAGRGVGGQEGERQIAAEPDPGEEDDEPDDQPVRAAAVRLLLREKVGVLAHGAGLFSDRSTLGTARSAASSISHRSAGVALASPATSRVGNVACLVLYCVATSL